MSQQVDLDELTRLHDKHCIHGRDTTEFIAPLFSALFQSFPALRDELVRLRASNAMNEDAANKGDNARQAAGAMESEISRLQDENGKLEKQRNNWKSFADKLQKANISKTRQLDEAKGLLEWGWTVIANAGVSLGDWESLHKDWPPVARDWEQKIHVFLASLAGSCNNCNDTGTGTFAGDPCHVCKPQQQEQPTQGEVCHSCKGEGVEYINAGDGLGDAIDCSKCKSAASKARYFYCAEFGTTWKITSNGEAFSKRKVHREEFIGPCVLGSVDLSVEGFLESDGWQEITAEEAGDTPTPEAEGGASHE